MTELSKAIGSTPKTGVGNSVAKDPSTASKRPRTRAKATPVAAPSSKAMSILDMAFFMLESRERMSNVGTLAILKPPPRTRSAKAFADRLLKQMKTHAVGAPFNLRYRPAGLQGLPCLQSTEDIDLDQHCHRLTLPAPGTDAQLFEQVCRLHEKRLDRTRPPWELYVFDGLEGGRIALYAKVHHGLIDGRGFVDVCTRWFNPDPADQEVRALWEGLPLRKRSAGEAAKGAPNRSVALQNRLRKTAKVLASMSSALTRQLLVSANITTGLALPFFGTSSALRGKPSIERSFAYGVLPLADMRSLGRAHGASINDVLLTVLDMALHRYLSEREQCPHIKPLVVDMPVSLGKGKGGGGNRIAVLQIPLGAPAASPQERLQQIVQRTAQLKEHVGRTDAAALVSYTAAVHGVPALLEALHLHSGPMLANMMISNPFGLAERRYLAGAELEMALPISLLSPGQALNITAATYDQGLQLAFLGLAAQIPNIQQLADLTLAAFSELRASLASPIPIATSN